MNIQMATGMWKLKGNLMIGNSNGIRKTGNPKNILGIRFDFKLM